MFLFLERLRLFDRDNVQVRSHMTKNNILIFEAIWFVDFLSKYLHLTMGTIEMVIYELKEVV